jgi:Domain of unknown function (DUF4158)
MDDESPAPGPERRPRSLFDGDDDRALLAFDLALDDDGAVDVRNQPLDGVVEFPSDRINSPPSRFPSRILAEDGAGILDVIVDGGFRDPEFAHQGRVGRTLAAALPDFGSGIVQQRLVVTGLELVRADQEPVWILLDLVDGRREILTSTERMQLLAFPDDEGELIRKHTLSKADLAFVRQHRGDHNRLGIAVQMCSLRYPGRVLGENERPPDRLLNLMATQLGISIVAWDIYAQRDENPPRTFA